jgi:hypothetical protein
MQTKTVKSVRENTRSYTGKNGTTYLHTITLDGPIDVEGQGVVDFEYHSLKPTCDAFVAGKEAKFEVEKKVSPDGKYTNYKIKPVKDAPAFGGGGSFKKAEPKDEGRISALSCASTAANYYSQRQGTEEQVLAFAEKLFQWASSKSSK